MKRLVLGVLVLNMLAGCTGHEGFVMPADGFIGPDLLANQSFATPVALPIAQTNQGVSVAIDPTGTQAAYATPDGVFVGPVGGEARKLAPWNGSVRQLRWATDGSALLVVESEREPNCIQTGNVTQCSSGTEDDYARLETIAVADGAKTVLAEHVYGLGGVAVADESAFFAGRIGLEMPDKTNVGQGGIYRVALDGGSAPEAQVTGQGLGAFALSPDGKRLAFVRTR